MLEVEVLGRCTLRVDGAEVDLGTRKTRALVAVLALDGPTSREELAELLWGELGEDGARQNLRKTLHRLRRTPLEPCLDTRGPLLALRVSRVDALELARLVAAGDFGQAQALGSGVLLDGLEFDSEAWTAWLEARRSQVAERQRAALTGLAAGHEARGDVRGALDLVQRALALDEFDEAATRDAMRYHLALGDRAGALRRYEHLRHLTAGLGLAPEPATGELAARARHPPARFAPPAVPADLLHAPLVGREASWRHLSALTVPLAVILGEPGVGKTRLATEFARTRGPFLVARGREEAARTPFAPFAGLLRSALSEGWKADALAEVWRLEAARLVPECAPGATLPPGEAHGRARFLEGLTRAVLDALGGATLILDDLHWFDEGSLELVAGLVRRAQGGRLLATARPHELGTAEGARRLLETLREGGLCATHAIGTLAEPDVLALIQALSGAGGGTLFARRLYAATSGHPLYLLELLRGLFETGELRAEGGGWATPYDDATRDYAELPIPETLRDTVLARVARLQPLTRHLLAAASLIGERFESAWLAGLEADTFSRLDALEGACRAGLLETEPTGLRFRHELLRRTLDESLGPERRRALHATLAGQLAHLQAPPERVAHHLERAGRGQDALPYLEQATVNAGQVFANHEALAYTERMLEYEQGDTRRWSLERRRLWFMRSVTDAETYARHLDRLEGLAGRSGDPDRLAEVCGVRGLFYLFRGQAAELAAEAERMLALPGLPGAFRAHALYLRGHARMRLGRSAQALDDFTQALELQQTAGDAETIVSTEDMENGLTSACLACGDFERAAFHNGQVLGRLDTATGLSSIYALNWQAHLGTLEGRFGAARVTFDRVAARALERRDWSALTWVLRHRASLLLALGEPDAAREDIGSVLRLSAGQYLRLEAVLTGLSAEAWRLRGEIGEALGAVNAALGAFEHLGASGADPAVAEARLTLAGLLTECGDLPAARAELEAVRALDETSDGLTLRLYRAARETAAARLDLMEGQPARALDRLRATPDLDHAPYVDRAAHATELARALALNGDGEGALRQLGALDLPPPLVPRALDVGLGAHLTRGEVPADLLARARTALTLEGAAPTDRLELAATVVRALDAAGHDPAEVRALAGTLLAALARSLEGRPGKRAGLLGRFQPGLHLS
ncbi:ATP-binding protein [Deinococcus aestuarii]|uniref:ATP-binding protein n=1 Tax=Deinococcus aestuarii TaxID=2774531 RepID=UPI001C0E760A|nr:AAA family ATPase [Deinococcus aestuarii]